MDTSQQDFRDIRHMKGFVDKTLLIQAVLTHIDSYILVTAPRRFGKSINLTMLQRFFEILPDEEEQRANRKLFENTLIEEDSDFMSKHCGKYPVLYLDFRSAGSVCSYDTAFGFVRKVVQSAFKRHAYLQSSDKLIASDKKMFEVWCDNFLCATWAKTDVEIYEALEELASYLVKHHGRKILVFVDEYDGICSDSVIYIEDKKNETTGEIISTAEREIKKTVAFCVGALSCLLKPHKDKNFVDRAVLRQVFRVL